MKIFILLVLLTSVKSCIVLSQSDKVYKSYEVDTTPEFIGGDEAEEKFIRRNLKWPSEDFGYSGYVVIHAFVNIDGRLKDVKLVKKLCPFCDKEAIRVVSLMPKWIPATKRGKKVNCEVEIPIHFKLE
ncbi:MAG: energy transducer TonB [Saprospiraceae bacterium]|nr:energy transducer TonB [Saprospiraceae bacterium]MBK7810030.1 energy transducer TonB [Saprospiraceae bacterium]MBK9629631.1 energy transducer TonB [Saprospiraceae bacterium]